MASKDAYTKVADGAGEAVRVSVLLNSWICVSVDAECAAACSKYILEIFSMALQSKSIKWKL